MLRGIRGRLAAGLCIVAATTAMAIVAGCGEDDETSAAGERAKPSAAFEPASVFVDRLAKLIETSRSRTDCSELDQINARSATRFTCPAAMDFRKSMERFKVVGIDEYGTGAVVDYKSGASKDGAAIALFVAPDRSWAVGRFGIYSKPSTDTSDEESRDGYAKAVEEFLTAVRERDCDTFVAVIFNANQEKKDAICKDSLPRTRFLAKRLEANPGAEPRYEGGNEAYGFYSLELPKPKPAASFTISVAKAIAKGPRPYVVLDATPAPTLDQRRAAQKALQKNQAAPNAGQPETSPSRKVEGDPNTLTN